MSLRQYNLPQMASETSKRRGRTLRPIDPSLAVEIDLLTILSRVVRTIGSEARTALLPVAAEEVAAFLRPKDEAGANARSVIAYLKQIAAQQVAIAEAAAKAAITREGARHTKKWMAAVEAGTGIDLRALISDDDLLDLLAVRSEVFNSLITNLSTDILHRIERETLGAILEGRGNEEIARKLREVAGIGRTRSRLIARDQASKLNGAMNQFRQEQAGITHYKWRTILDGRERPTHHANNNRIFPWAKAPATGHPGWEINCRCRGIAVIDPEPETLPDIAEPLPDDLLPGGSPENADAWWQRYGVPANFAEAKAPGPVGGAHAKEFYRGPDGELWMFKPVGEAEAFRSLAEEAVYKVQRLVDPLAIETRFIRIKDRPGSIQRWQTGLAEPMDYLRTPITKIPDGELAQLQREHVVDWLTAQHDSHPGQFVRGKNGHVWGIDKGQAFRWLGKDELSTTYHPNAIYGEKEPIYNAMFRAYGKGEISLDIETALAHARVLQSLPDDDYRAIIGPYVEGRFKTVAEREAFVRTALDRKNGLVEQLEAFYRGLDNALPREILDIIKGVAKAGPVGKAIPLDKDGIEDHNVIVFEVEIGGETHTVMTGRIRQEYGAKVSKAIAEVTEAGLTAGNLLSDGYYDRIFRAIKSVNLALDKGNAPGGIYVEDAIKARLALQQLLSGGSPSEIAMANYYLDWIDHIEGAVKVGAKGPKIPNFTRFEYVPPKATVTAPKSMTAVRSQRLREEERKVKNGKLSQLTTPHLRDGVQDAVTWADGSKGYYRPWIYENSYADRGMFEIVVKGAASEKTVSQAIRNLERWDIDLKPATSLDIDLAYLHRQAALTGDYKLAAYKTIIADLNARNADVAERVKALMRYWEKKLGVSDLRALETWRPTGEHISGIGRRVHSRFDLTEAELMDKLGQYRVFHKNTAQSMPIADLVESVVDNTGGMMLSQIERRRLGIRLGTMSPGKDLDTGGAQYFFTRILKLKTEWGLQSGFYWKPSVLRRQDAITFDADRYGEVKDGGRDKWHLSGIDGMKKAATSGGNETIFKGALSLLDGLDFIIADTSSSRLRIIAALKKIGLTEIDGIPIERRVGLVGEKNSVDVPSLKTAYEKVEKLPEGYVPPASQGLPAMSSAYGGNYLPMSLSYTVKGVPKPPSIQALSIGKEVSLSYIKSYITTIQHAFAPEGKHVVGPAKWKAAGDKAKVLLAAMSKDQVQALITHQYWKMSNASYNLQVLEKLNLLKIVEKMK